MTRRLLAIAGCGALVAASGLSARGQLPAAPPGAGTPQYYQGRVSPASPGSYPGRPGGVPAQPAPAPTYPPPADAKPATKPRLSTPVMAGAEGVRQVSDSRPVRDRLAPPAPTGDDVRRAVGAEPSPGGTPPFFVPKADAPPEPKPLTPPALPTMAPPPSVGDAPVAPAFKLPAPLTTEPAALPVPVPTTNVAPPAEPPASPAPNVAPTQSAPTPPAGAPRGDALPSRAAPAVSVELLAPDTIGVGQNLAYELVVKNAGPTAVANVRVEDELPPQSTLVSSEPAAESAGGRLAFTLGALESGAERRVKITVKPGEEGELRSRATVSYASSIEARVRVTRPRVAVSLSGPESARVGGRIPMTIKLTNSGSGPAQRIQLQAKFSEGLAHPEGSVIQTELKELAAGQTRTFNLEVTAGKPGAQSCTISAAADGQPGETTKASVSVVEPMLSAKLAGPPHCFVNGEPDFALELTNPGTAATDALQVWAQLPAGFELAQASDAGAFAEANRAVGWRLAGLAAGGSKTVTMKLRAVAPSEGVIRVVAQMTPPEVTVTQAGVGGATSAPLEARSEVAVKSEGVPALRFEVIDAEDPVRMGSEAVYEVRVMNQGTGPCSNVQLTAELAEGTASAGATGATAARVTGQQIAFEPIAQFGVKQEAVYRVRVKSAQTGDFRFRVRLSCDQVRTPVVKEENTRFY